MKDINWERTAAILRLWQGIVAVTSGVTVAGVLWAIGSKLPPQIPLFYSRPWGEEQLSSPWGLIWPVGAILVIVGISWLVTQLRGVEKILAAFVAGTGLVAEVIIVTGIIRIVLLIT